MSPYVWPALNEGVTSVVVDGQLEDIEPMAYRFLMNFARDNELEVRIGRVPAKIELAAPQANELATPV